jgi:ribosomal protein S18 acetylase RimI-like enzyme
VHIQRMLPKHIESVVRVHLESFPGFFLSSLGPGFLRLFYQGVLNDETGIAVIAEREDVVLGFVCGSNAPRGFYRRLFQKQWWRFGWAAMGALARRPWMVRRFLGAVRMRVVSEDAAPAAELMSLAISPHAQRQGLGGDLVLRFLAEARSLGASRVTLTTDRQANQHVNSFYHRLGFALAASFVTNTGREMNRYEINTSMISSIG